MQKEGKPVPIAHLHIDFLIEHSIMTRTYLNVHFRINQRFYIDIIPVS